MTPERFLENVILDDETGCWIWRPWLGKSGRPRLYGSDPAGHSHVINVAKTAYELFIAEAPVDTELHHTCFHEWCVKPIHVQPLTIAEHKLVHQQLGKRPAGHQARGDDK